MVVLSALLAIAIAFASASPNRNYARDATTTVVHVNISKTFQTFDGLGFSQAFQRGSLIFGSDGLSPGNSRRVLDLLFSPTIGAGFTILRNGIGSSVAAPYDLMKSIQPTSPGSPTAKPNYVFDGDDNGQVRLTREAIKRGVKHIYADAWSAPGYMKNTGSDSFGGYLCGVTGVNCTSGDWRQAYADYLVAYLKFYKQEGISVGQVGFLNEPDLNVSYASMLSTGQQAADFLKLFHPTLKASGLTTQLTCCDGGGWEEARGHLQGIQQAGAEGLVDIITAHGYKSPPGSPFNTTKKTWQTEWADLNGPRTLGWHRNGSTGEGLTWALNIQNAYTASNVSAFLYWLGAGNGSTNSALILLRNDKVVVSKRLWAFAHFGRFVKPGAVRVEAKTQGNSRVSSSAFQNPDGSVSIQVINNGGRDACVTVDGLDFIGRGLRGYLSDNDNDISRFSVHSLEEDDCTLIPRKSMISYVLSKKFGPV